MNHEAITLAVTRGIGGAVFRDKHRFCVVMTLITATEPELRQQCRGELDPVAADTPNGQIFASLGEELLGMCL